MVSRNKSQRDRIYLLIVRESIAREWLSKKENRANREDVARTQKGWLDAIEELRSLKTGSKTDPLLQLIDKQAIAKLRRMKPKRFCQFIDAMHVVLPVPQFG